MTAPGTWYARTEGQDVFSMEIVAVSSEEMIFDTWRNVEAGLEHVQRSSIANDELDHLLEEGEWVFVATPVVPEEVDA